MNAQELYAHRCDMTVNVIELAKPFIELHNEHGNQDFFEILYTKSELKSANKKTLIFEMIDCINNLKEENCIPNFECALIVGNAKILGLVK